MKTKIISFLLLLTIAISIPSFGSSCKSVSTKEVGANLLSFTFYDDEHVWKTGKEWGQLGDLFSYLGDLYEINGEYTISLSYTAIFSVMKPAQGVSVQFSLLSRTYNQLPDTQWLSYPQIKHPGTYVANGTSTFHITKFLSRYNFNPVQPKMEVRAVYKETNALGCAVSYTVTTFKLLESTTEGSKTTIKIQSLVKESELPLEVCFISTDNILLKREKILFDNVEKNKEYTYTIEHEEFETHPQIIVNNYEEFYGLGVTEEEST